MQSVAVGWQVFEITHRPLDLGYVGLAQFLPGILLSIPAGHAADRFDRRAVLLTCYVSYGLCSVLLLLQARGGASSVLPIFAVLILLSLLGIMLHDVVRRIGRRLVFWIRSERTELMT